jgi:hypothetical protein
MNAIDTLEYERFTSVVESPSLFARLTSWWRARASTAPLSVDPASYSPCDPPARLAAFRRLIQDAESLYVFRNGTGVWSAHPLSEADAVELLRAHGGVRLGSPSADFSVAVADAPVPSFVVRYSHPHIVNVEPVAKFGTSCSRVIAGSLMRLSRAMDAQDLCVVARDSQHG